MDIVVSQIIVLIIGGIVIVLAGWGMFAPASLFPIVFLRR